MSNRIPLVDCSYDFADRDFRNRIEDIFDSGNFIGGEDIEVFESRWKALNEAGDCITTSSGTAALTLLFKYIQSKGHQYSRTQNGNRVLIPATSFVATRDAAFQAGLSVGYVDVNERGLMDPKDLMRKLRKYDGDIIAVVPVHLYGQVADMETIEHVCEAFDVPHIIEDACQAHGASYMDGTPVGSRHPAAWSFMPAKILGTCGDAGAVTLPESNEDADWFRAMRNHGRSSHNEHEYVGYKMRMGTLQAAVLNYNLEFLAESVACRQNKADFYKTELSDTPLRLQPYSVGRVWSYFACWAPNENIRDALVDYLDRKSVSTGKHYPYSLNQDQFFDSDKNPTAEELARTTLSLPLWPDMSYSEQVRVANSIRSFFGG